MPPKKNKNNKENNITGLLREACSLLRNKIESPELEAELLLSHILKKDRVFLLSHGDNLVNHNLADKFTNLVKKRLAGWSVAVLLGYKEFYGLKFLMNKDVLVPRPETELLVEMILKQVQTKRKAFIIDIGTGSGAIITSLFKSLEEKKGFEFYASDKSAAALRIARLNAKLNRAKINLLKGDLMAPHFPYLKKSKPKDLIIAANLPYLTPDQMKEPSIKKEPQRALLSGSDGLWHYRRLFSQLKKYLKDVEFSTEVYLVCEINPEQAVKIEKLAKTSFPSASTYFKNDYSKRIRFFILEI